MDLNEIPEDVRRELADVRFMYLTHGTRHTYDADCRGPLCRKANRDSQRARMRRKAEREGTTIRPYGRFGTHPARERDELLERIFEWHSSMQKSLPRRRRTKMADAS